MSELRGHCMCGAVRWSAPGPTTRNLVCHCTDCQRATSAPFTGFVGLEPETVIWSGEINHYESTHGTWRGFCPNCGSRLYFRSDKWPEETHIHAATLADDTVYSPTAEVVCRSRASWLNSLDGIPKHNSFQADPQES
ncbi:MAG: GFA family protein [Boseongicola sp.]